MLNVNQESCEYQLFKSCRPTRRGNRTQVYLTTRRRVVILMKGWEVCYW